MPRRTSLPPDLRGRAFTTAQGRAAGCTPAQLRGPLRWSPYRGVHLDAALPDTLPNRCAAVRALWPSAVFSHWTAARLLDLPVDAGPGVHVTLPSGALPPVRPGLHPRLCALTAAEVCFVEGLAVTAAPRVYVDLAACLTRTDLVILGDAVLNKRRSTLPELRAAVEVAGGRRGCRAARAALPLLEPRADSAGETRVRLCLLAAGLPRPQANVDVYDEAGGWVARPDLAYVTAKVAIQYDGATSAASNGAVKTWPGTSCSATWGGA